jgi:RNA polymerase sigma-70 factor (ECF subfamily)
MPVALNSEAFTEALARHGRALWVIASAWVGRSEADDLVQETARVAWQQRAQCKLAAEAGPWLSTIARHLGSNWRRKRRPEARSNEQLPEAVAATIAAADWPFDADRAGLSDTLANALASLSEAARACLLLHVVIGLSFVEIAAMLEIPENTAMSHARRARQSLRESLSQSQPSNPFPQPN